MTRPSNPELRQGNPRSAEVAPATTSDIEPVEIPPAPDHLNEVGAAYWFAVWTAGGRAYHPATDRYAIERYCSLQARRHYLLGVLEAEGYTTVGSQGQIVAHPAAKLLSDIETKLTPLEDRLGLNPEARLRLGIAAIDHKSRLDAFLDGAPGEDEDDFFD